MRPEDQLQASICQFLDRALPDDAWYCAIPNGSVLAGAPAKRAMQMNKLKRTGLKVGAPDLFVVYGGFFYAIELKAGKGKQSDSQQSVAGEINHAGGYYSIVRSLEECEAFLLAMCVPLRASCKPV